MHTRNGDPDHPKNSAGIAVQLLYGRVDARMADAGPGDFRQLSQEK